MYPCSEAYDTIIFHIASVIVYICFIRFQLIKVNSSTLSGGVFRHKRRKSKPANVGWAKLTLSEGRNGIELSRDRHVHTTKVQ